MKILKFGSATIDDVHSIKHVLNLLEKQQNNIIVLSSIKGFAEYLEDISNYFYNKNTEGAFDVLNQFVDSIFKLVQDLYSSDLSKKKAKEAIDEFQNYVKLFDGELFTLFEKRALMAQGELITSKLFELALLERNVKVNNLPALDFIRMDRNHYPDMPYIKKALSFFDFQEQGVIFITQGYICRNSYGEIDDLRKGGSDLTASIIGATLNVEVIQIWGKDPIMYNIDKTAFDSAKVIRKMTFDESAELTYFSSKILHPSSIFPAKLANVPVRLLSLNDVKDEGTLITNSNIDISIKSIGTRSDITLIQIKSSKMLLAHGFLKKVFDIFDRFETPIDMIATSEIGISLTIDNTDKLSLIEEELRRLGTIRVYHDMLMISIVGDGIMHTPSISEKILNTIKEVPLKMISYGGSDLNISFLIPLKLKMDTLKLLHKNLF